MFCHLIWDTTWDLVIISIRGTGFWNHWLHSHFHEFISEIIAKGPIRAGHFQTYLYLKYLARVLSKLPIFKFILVSNHHWHGIYEYGLNTWRKSQGVFEQYSPLTSQGKLVLLFILFGELMLVFEDLEGAFVMMQISDDLDFKPESRWSKGVYTSPQPKQTNSHHYIEAKNWTFSNCCFYLNKIFERFFLYIPGILGA